jgi:hypothetical protein
MKLNKKSNHTKEFLKTTIQKINITTIVNK